MSFYYWLWVHLYGALWSSKNFSGRRGRERRQSALWVSHVFPWHVLYGSMSRGHISRLLDWMLWSLEGDESYLLGTFMEFKASGYVCWCSNYLWRQTSNLVKVGLGEHVRVNLGACVFAESTDIWSALMLKDKEEIIVGKEWSNLKFGIQFHRQIQNVSMYS